MKHKEKFINILFLPLFTKTVLQPFQFQVLRNEMIDITAIVIFNPLGAVVNIVIIIVSVLCINITDIQLHLSDI